MVYTLSTVLCQWYFRYDSVDLANFLFFFFLSLSLSFPPSKMGVQMFMGRVPYMLIGHFSYVTRFVSLSLTFNLRSNL